MGVSRSSNEGNGRSSRWRRAEAELGSLAFVALTWGVAAFYLAQPGRSHDLITMWGWIKSVLKLLLVPGV
jgi:hypothetical protein